MFKRENRVNSFSEIFKNIENSIDNGREVITEDFYSDIDISYMKKVYRVGRVSVAYLDSIPENYKNDTEIVALKNKILFIRVENPILLQELNLIKDELLDSINQKIESNINNIIFKLGKIDEKKSIDIIIDDESIPVIDVNNSKEEFQKIDDENLREKLNSIFESFEKIKFKLEKKGFKKCEKCGNVYSSTYDECDICKSIHERYINKGFLFIKENPWSSVKEFVNKTNLDEEIYIKSKNRVESVLLKKINKIILSNFIELGEIEKKKLRKELEKYLIIYSNLKSNKFIPQLEIDLLGKYFENVKIEKIKKIIEG